MQQTYASPSAADAFFSAPLAETDPDIAATIQSEVTRQRAEIELIASENFVSSSAAPCSKPKARC
jgi:glycine hydroxymethyltransferase